MKFYRFLYLSFILLISCTSIPKGYHRIDGAYEAIGNESCNKIMQKIKKKWSISDTCNTYYFNQKLVNEIIKEKNCFIGMDTSQIIKIFGRPTDTEDRSFKYSLSNCNELFYQNYYNSLILNIKFDKVGGISFNKLVIFDQ